MKKMNVLIINPYYYPNMIGGTEHSIKILAESLQMQGINVAVYSYDSNTVFTEEVINGVKVFRGHADWFTLRSSLVKSSKIQSLFFRFIEFRNKKIIDDLDYIVSNFKPDIIHTNNLYGISTYVWNYFKRNKIKIVHTIRDYWMMDPSGKLGKSNKWLINFYRAMFRKQSNKFVDFVTAPSYFTLNSFLNDGYFKNSISRCIVNSINLDLNETRKIIERNKMKNSQHINYLYVGTLQQHKGVSNLLQAFMMVDNPNISLDICGNGELLDVVIKAAEKDPRIKYCGQLTSEKLKEKYIMSDILIVPSIWEEPFGRIIIEGNQYGLVVIGSNRAGIKETLDTMQSGVCYQYDSINELCSKIQYFSKRDNIVKYYNNIIKNISIYSSEKQVELFVEIYNEALKRNTDYR